MLCIRKEREREGESVCLNGENSFFDRPQMLLMPLQRPTNTHSTEMEATEIRKCQLLHQLQISPVIR